MLAWHGAPHRGATIPVLQYPLLPMACMHHETTSVPLDRDTGGRLYLWLRQVHGLTNSETLEYYGISTYRYTREPWTSTLVCTQLLPALYVHPRSVRPQHVLILIPARLTHTRVLEYVCLLSLESTAGASWRSSRYKQNCSITATLCPSTMRCLRDRNRLELLAWRKRWYRQPKVTMEKKKKKAKLTQGNGTAPFRGWHP